MRLKPTLLAAAIILGMSGTGLLAQHLAPAPTADAEDAGAALYQQMCGACHGAAGGGGPGGAINLSRSSIAMTPDQGQALQAFLASGRPESGMPPFAVSAGQAAQLSRVIRSFARPDRPAQSGTDDATVLVGDAAVGREFFNGPVGGCSSCHAVTEGEASSATNLAHVATRYDSVMDLQNAMVLNRSFFWSPALNRDVTARITYADGREFSGYLTSVSDFKIIIRDEQNREIVIERANGEPNVVLVDRMQHHLDLLEVYRDEDMHNLTAYLATMQ